MKNRAIAFAVLTAVLSATSPSFAQDDPATLAARARFNEGVAAYDKGQYESARLSFQQAYAIKKHPSVLLNLAQSSGKSGHALDAAHYFQQYIKEVPTASSAQKADAEKGLEEARKQLGRIEIIAPSGTEITLDDKERIGSTPFPEPLDVEPGAHSLKSSAETVRVTAVAGQKVQAKFGLASTATPTPVVAPPANISNTVSNTNENTVNVNVDTGAKKKGRGLPDNMVPAYVGFGVAGVGLITGIIFAIFKSDAQSKADSVSNDIRAAALQRGQSPTGVCSSTNASIQTAFNNACTTLKDDNSKVNTDATVANIAFFGLVPAGLLFAGGWMLWGPRQKEDGSAFYIRPYGGPGNAGLTAGGSF